MKRGVNGGTSRWSIVVGDEFGELGLIYNLLPSLSRAYQLQVLLPTTLYQLNKASFNSDYQHIEWVEYDGSDAILQASLAWKPEGVILASGYLFIPSGLFDKVTFWRWIARMQSTDIALVTTDPFLNCASRLSLRDVRIGEHPQMQNVPDWRRWLMLPIAWFNVRWSAWVLRRSVHLYSYLHRPIMENNKQCSSLSPPRFPVFGGNEKGEVVQSESECEYKRSRERGEPYTQMNNHPYWLFIISRLDYEMQIGEHGVDRWLRLLITKIEEVAKLGRSIILILPEILRILVEQALLKLNVADLDKSKSNNCQILSAIDLKAYQAISQAAEYVFYWNPISHSIYDRLMSKKPVIFFHQGHINKLFPSVYRRAIELYYGGEHPVIVDFEKPLVESELQRAASQFVKQHEDVVDALKEQPPIELMLETTLSLYRSRSSKR